MSLNNSIETILFDLDGTLRHNTPSAEKTLTRIARELGARIPAERGLQAARWAHYYWAQSPELLADIQRFDKLEPEFWVNYAYRYLMALGVPEPQAADLAPALSSRMETEYTPESTVHPEDLETLAGLRQRGFILGLVSNRTLPFDEEIQELGLKPYFDFAYVAGEVNAWKPDPTIFERAFALSNSAPEHSLYIGDNYYADIIGARAAGMQPVLLDPHGLFPKADCPVIHRLDELVNLLPPRGKTLPRG